jgi:PKD repeat protein
MFKRKLLILFLLIPYYLLGQLSEPGIPYGFKTKFKSNIEIPTTELQLLDTKKLIAEDSARAIDNRFAVVQNVSIDIIEAGYYSVIDSQGYLFKYRFLASNAVSLGVRFSNFKLPRGAKVFIYNSAHRELLGAYTKKNNKNDGFLAISPFFGNEIIVEYFEPTNAEFKGELKIGSISMAYDNVVARQVYNDITCEKWSDWDTLKHSVCRMIFDDGPESFYCSGALINNTRNDGIPYFLTANHCIHSEASANSLVLYFNYENDTCDGSVIQNNQTISGATLLSNNSNVDVSLLELKEIPDQSYHPYYAGWDRSGSNPGVATGIHHPKGLYKCIAQSNLKSSIYPYSITWDDGTISRSRTHWEVSFTDGTTDNGSSGSPIFDNKKHIFGQLHGGDNTINYYGALSVSWNYVKNWLDPDNINVTAIDGMKGKVIPIANFSVSPEYACSDALVQLTDSSTYDPTMWKWSIIPSYYTYVEGDDSTRSPKVVFNVDTIYNIQLTASNENGSSTVNKEVVVGDLNFKFVEYPVNKEICGYQLVNTPVKVSGDYLFNYSFDQTSRINYTINNNEILLSLKDEARKDSSFYTTILAEATHGTCKAFDTLILHVKIPINDFAKNALKLKLGESGPYNNECASTELNEPHPPDAGCNFSDSWCVDTSNRKKVVNNTLWFNFQGPSNGIVNIETRGFDTRIAVYDAVNAADLFETGRFTRIASNDNQADKNPFAKLKNVKVEYGKKYWLQLDGFKKDYGDAYVHLYSNAMEVYPNPAIKKVSVQISTDEPTDGHIEIISQTGNVIYSKNEFIDISNNIFNFDLSGFSPGLYMVLCTIGNNTYTSKLMVINK